MIHWPSILTHTSLRLSRSVLECGRNREKASKTDRHITHTRATSVNDELTSVGQRDSTVNCQCFFVCIILRFLCKGSEIVTSENDLDCRES